MSVNKLNAFLSWGSVFAWCWVTLLNIVDLSLVSIVVFVFFVVVALFSGVSLFNEERSNHNENNTRKPLE